MLTSVDNSGIRLNWTFDCLDRRDFESLLNFALNDWICGNLGEGGGLDVGICSMRETRSVCKGRKNNSLQVTLKCSPMTDVIVSLEP